MSLQSDIVTALSSVASGRVYPQAAPADAAMPFVIYRILNKNPLTRLNGAEGISQFSVVFESYADTYAQALTTSAAVVSAIQATSLIYYPDSSPGEEYEPAIDAYMEPVYFGFWHS